MASPFDLPVDQQVRLIATWQDFLALANDPASPLHGPALETLARLNKRNYAILPKSAAKGAKTEAERGAALHKTLDDAHSAAATHGQTLATAEAVFEKEVGPAREFLRSTHRTVAAIARDQHEPVLAGLPLLGEVSVPARMEKSADNFLSFLRRKDVLTVLGNYNITLEEIETGRAKVTAATQAWKTFGEQKGAKSLVNKKAVASREEAVSWLAKWWNLGRGVLGDRPDLLKLLGVVEGAYKGGSATGSNASEGGGTPDTLDP